MKMTDKTSNILYYSGLILLAIGAFGLTFAAFFAIIGLPVFVIGVILVLVSLKKTWKQRLIPIGIFIVSIIAFWPIWRGINTVGPEVFLIPENYRGRVNIIYKEGSGIKLEKTKEGLVYEIPNDGILILDKEQKYGFDFLNFPCKTLRANNIYGLVGTLAHNLTRILSFVMEQKWKSVKCRKSKKLKRVRQLGYFSKKVRSECINIAGQLVRSARRMKLRLNSKTREVLDKIMINLTFKLSLQT